MLPILKVALENQNRNFKYPLKVANFDIVMQVGLVHNMVIFCGLQWWTYLKEFYINKIDLYG